TWPIDELYLVTISPAATLAGLIQASMLSWPVMSRLGLSAASTQAAIPSRLKARPPATPPPAAVNVAPFLRVALLPPAESLALPSALYQETRPAGLAVPVMLTPSPVLPLMTLPAPAVPPTVLLT